MNELFESHKKLNIKKVALAIVLFLFLITIIFDLFSNLLKKENNNTVTIEKKDATSPNSIFYDSENKISIELSKQYELNQYQSTNDYLIELRSPNNLDIFISKKDLVENHTLSEVVSADSNSYIENFNSYSNLSDVSEFIINDKIAYTYSFHYLDKYSKTPFYLQVVWLETSSCYYIFDIEFPLDNIENYTKILNETLTSFKEI